jgi:hypothetical protein
VPYVSGNYSTISNEMLLLVLLETGAEEKVLG